MTLKSRGLVRLNVQGIRQDLSTESKPVVFSKSKVLAAWLALVLELAVFGGISNVLYFISYIKCNSVKAMQVVHKERVRCIALTNVKYKLEYFDCFPSDTSTFYQAFIGAYLLFGRKGTLHKRGHCL